MDLRNFSNQEVAEEAIRNAEHINKTAGGNSAGGMNEQNVRDAIKHYSSFSNDQLMGELSRQLGLMRSNGKGSDIENTVARIKPFLNEDQRKRLEEIMGSMNGK